MTVKVISHASVADRRAHGADARISNTARGAHRVGPDGRPTRPGGPARAAGRDAGVRPGAGPARPDDGVAVHLLPGCGA